MRKRDALLSARSYLTILLGFLLGFAIVVWVEKQMPTRVESSAGISLSNDFPPLPAPRELTFEEAIWARVAWQYYVNNTQPNGLANAHDGEPWLSLWSTGSYLFAVAAARQLNVLTSEEFDERIAAALAALASLPLNPQGLPAAYYHADTLETLGKPDASAIGMGRLLNALQTLLWRYPQHAGAPARNTQSPDADRNPHARQTLFQPYGHAHRFHRKTGAARMVSERYGAADAGPASHCRAST